MSVLDSMRGERQWNCKMERVADEHAHAASGVRGEIVRRRVARLKKKKEEEEGKKKRKKTSDV